jgi:anthranilate synthase component 1
LNNDPISLHLQPIQKDKNKELMWVEAYLSQYKVPKIDELPDFNGGLVGYFGYEIIRYIEPKLAKISQPNYLIDTVRTCMAPGFCLKSHLIALVHLHSFAYLD